MRRLWGDRWPDPESRKDGAPLELTDAIASLLAGDAAQRAVYAAAFGRAEAAVDLDGTALARACLAVTMGDGYPSVRWLAQRSLVALERRTPIGIEDVITRIDHTAGVEERRRDVFRLLDALAAKAPGRLRTPEPGSLLKADFRLDLASVIRLTNLQSKNSISIGE
jgi:hypothetical protein